MWGVNGKIKSIRITKNGQRTDRYLEDGARSGLPTGQNYGLGGKMREQKLYLKGFTFIEIILVVAIIGILLIMAYPNIMSSLETRSLENTAREIQTTLQQAKFQSVKYKLNHRIQFDNSQGYWVYYILRETSQGTWVEVPQFFRRSIPSKYVTAINLPNQRVDFSPLGLVLNYNFGQNTISVQSTVLQRHGQPSVRTLNIFAGGSIQYVKSS